MKVSHYQEEEKKSNHSKNSNYITFYDRHHLTFERGWENKLNDTRKAETGKMTGGY